MLHPTGPAQPSIRLFYFFARPILIFEKSNYSPDKINSQVLEPPAISKAVILAILKLASFYESVLGQGSLSKILPSSVDRAIALLQLQLCTHLTI